MPRWHDSATFSAASRHTEQRMNSVSPSFHSLLWRSNCRGVEATVKFATAAPDGVKRSSGSAVRLPMIVMTVSPAMDQSFVGGSSGSVTSLNQAPGRSSLVRMIDSLRFSWRSSSWAVAGSAVIVTTT